MATEAVGGGPDQTSTGESACGFDSASQEDPQAGLYVVADGDRDISVLLQPDSHGVTQSIVQVAGFPAVQERLSASSVTPCKLMIGVADGQNLEVKVLFGSTRDHPPIEQTCQLTMKAAEFAVQTLLATR